MSKQNVAWKIIIKSKGPRPYCPCCFRGELDNGHLRNRLKTYLNKLDKNELEEIDNDKK